MPDFSITFARSARRELEALPPRTAERIFGAIEKLAILPRPHGSIKLQGSSDLWRLRVGDYRVIYSIADRARTVDVIHVRHRRDAYR